MLYHGLIVIGTSAILLVIYNLIIVKWCARRHSGTTSSTSLQSSVKRFNDISMMVPIFKYKKDSKQTGGSVNDDQCSVCLSVFEDGEDLKLLPVCKHSFHKQCIDMWLYSHLDCPICRTNVLPSTRQLKQKSNEPTRQDMDPANMV